MPVFTAIWETKVYLIFIGLGMYWFLNGLFPPDPKDDPEFYHWEVDENDGAPVNLFGITKVLKQPTVLKQGMMSPSTARMVALIVGSVFILIGTLGILHYLHLGPFTPTDGSDL